MVVAVATVAGVVTSTFPPSGRAAEEAAPIYGITLPPGYRYWSLISVAHIGGSVNDVRAKLGNDVAIKVYRDGTLPFPDGTIIARLAWSCVPSKENNKALRPLLERRLSPDAVQKVLAESFVAGPAMNVQLMVKNQGNTPRPAAGGSLNSTTVTCRRGGPQNLLSLPRARQR